MEVSPTVAGGSTGRFEVDGMLSLPLTRSWCATWFALTRHGGVDVVGSFDGFLIVLHGLRLLCVILVDVIISSYFPSVILPISLFSDSIVPRQRGCLNICSCMLHIDFLIGQLDRGHTMFNISLVCVF